jgi:predicted acyltransferase
MQLLAGLAILTGYWAWFVATPVPGAMPWESFAVHFQKNENAAAYFDRWFLNLFPRDKPFEANAGGYTTLNFVPSIVTMLLGLMAGELLQSNRPNWSKVARLHVGAVIVLTLGVILHETQVCPNVKRIWTPSWTLFSGGYTLAILATLFLVIDVIGWRLWAMPLVVLGVNSILLYLFGMMLRPWTLQQIRIHFGQDLFLNTPLRPILEASAVMAVFWLLCWWLYRQRLFVRI